MDCPCLFCKLSYEKGGFFCDGGVVAVADLSCELLFCHASLR